MFALANMTTVLLTVIQPIVRVAAVAAVSGVRMSAKRMSKKERVLFDARTNEVVHVFDVMHHENRAPVRLSESQIMKRCIDPTTGKNIRYAELHAILHHIRRKRIFGIFGNNWYLVKDFPQEDKCDGCGKMRRDVRVPSRYRDLGILSEGEFCFFCRKEINRGKTPRPRGEQTKIDLTIMNPGDPSVGIPATTIDVSMKLNVGMDQETKLAFEHEIKNVLAPWFDVKPKHIHTANELKMIEKGELP